MMATMLAGIADSRMIGSYSGLAELALRVARTKCPSSRNQKFQGSTDQ